VRHDERELIAAEPGYNVTLADAAAKPIGDCDE
jgi:hypothetical protein